MSKGRIACLKTLDSIERSYKDYLHKHKVDPNVLMVDGDSYKRLSTIHPLSHNKVNGYKQYRGCDVVEVLDAGTPFVMYGVKK